MTCQKQLMKEGKSYPRTCAECGLGPCHETPEKEQPWPPSLSMDQKTPAEWAKWVESIPIGSRREFIQTVIEGAYKHGFRDGLASTDGVEPWEKEDKG